jgi:hypothetical protein
MIKEWLNAYQLKKEEDAMPALREIMQEIALAGLQRAGLGFKTEERLLHRPFSFSVKCFTIPDLFAGKMHALLFRKWINNVKGRDWFDMEWYIKKGEPLHLHHFLLRAKDSGSWEKETITEDELRELLKTKIDSVNFDLVKTDIRRFIPDPRVLDIWGPHYFHELVTHLKVI